MDESSIAKLDHGVSFYSFPLIMNRAYRVPMPNASEWRKSMASMIPHPVDLGISPEVTAFFDEATNALDANNEKVILENLNEFFAGKTVVVVAHRLSTVKNAHQIVVLEKGSLVEIGTHEELTRKQGAYFNLVKNQLELGN